MGVYHVVLGPFGYSGIVILPSMSLNLPPEILDPSISVLSSGATQPEDHPAGMLSRQDFRPSKIPSHPSPSFLRIYQK